MRIVLPFSFIYFYTVKNGRFLGYSPCYYKHRKNLKMGEEKLKKN